MPKLEGRPQPDEGWGCCKCENVCQPRDEHIFLFAYSQVLPPAGHSRIVVLDCPVVAIDAVVVVVGAAIASKLSSVSLSTPAWSHCWR